MSLTGKPSLTTLEPIANDGFWPDLEIGDLMSQYRIPPEYDDDVIKNGLIMSMIRVNSKLTAVKLAVMALPYTAFADYAEAEYPDTINNVNVLQLHYEHAVFTRAKAYLLKQFNSLNRKANAENAAKESDDDAEFWLNASQGSIQAIFNAVIPDDESVSGTANVYAMLL
jgi:Phage head completion protein (GPL)